MVAATLCFRSWKAQVSSLCSSAAPRIRVVRSGWRSPKHRRHHGVAIPPVRLRLNLRVQVDQVEAELLGVGCEMGAVRTRFAFGHRGLLSKPLVA
jgi:hypothetical protein